MLRVCEWLGDSWIGIAIREAKWGFAVMEMLHLLALALFGGALLVTGLRVFGFFLSEQRPSVMTRDLGSILIGSFAAMILSGILLFMDGPLRYYGNAAFRVKLSLIAAAAATAFVTHMIGRRAPAGPAAPLSMKAVTALSLTLWLSAGIAGRLIAIL
jgi:hypothetical protein